MSRTVLWVVVGIVFAAMATVIVRQQGELRQLRAAMAQVQRQAAAEARAAQSLRTRKETVREQQRVAEAQAASIAAPAEDAGAVTPVRAVSGRGGPTNPATPFAGIAKMMKSPGMKSMIRAQHKGQIEMSYGALFKGLGLSGEEQEALKKLLLDKQMALVDLSMSFMDSAAKPDHKDLAAKIAELTKSYDAEIKALLGEDDFQVYQQFEATQPERMQVSMFKQALSGEDALSEQQEHDLILALYDERKNYPEVARQFDRANPPDPSTFTDSMVTNQLALLARMQARNVERAATVLTASQLEEFRKSQEQMRAMQEMGLKMATQMFGGNKGGAAR